MSTIKSPPGDDEARLRDLNREVSRENNGIELPDTQPGKLYSFDWWDVSKTNNPLIMSHDSGSMPCIRFDNRKFDLAQLADAIGWLIALDTDRLLKIGGLRGFMGRPIKGDYSRVAFIRGADFMFEKRSKRGWRDTFVPDSVLSQVVTHSAFLRHLRTADVLL